MDDTEFCGNWMELLRWASAKTDVLGMAPIAVANVDTKMDQFFREIMSLRWEMC